MKASARNGALCLGLVLFVLVSLLPGQVQRVPARTQVSEAYGKLPLAFEENRGQTDSRVKFLSRGAGHMLFLASDEAVLALGGQGLGGRADARESVPGERARGVLRMALARANRSAQVAGLEQLPGVSNYLAGNDPARWRTNVRAYAKVEYRGVYPGVNLVYYGNQRQLEYDFVVAPGADPRQVRLRMRGAETMQVDQRGDLVLRVAGNEVRFRKPHIYQDVDGLRRQIAGAYVLQPAIRNPKSAIGEVGFRVGAYDTSRPLVIDPVLVYSTYLGGTGNDRALAIAIDSAGNAYITGSTSSLDFPLSNAMQPAANGTGSTDIFIAKLNAAGSALVYSTYIGGNGYDYGQAIAVDAAGNAYVTGYTASTDFPTAAPFQSTLKGSFDAFVLKLNASGSALTYSTYLGGSDLDVGYGIAVDKTGNAYVTGWTSSTDYPTVNPLRSTNGGNSKADAFITKLNPSGSALVYSTYMGGSGSDYGYAIAVDGPGNAYITGSANSTDYPVTAATQNSSAGAPDAFVTAVNSSGSGYLYSTYFGGAGGDAGQGIAVDSAGNAYVTGFTNSTNFRNAAGLQAKNAGDYDAFVFKLNPNGTVGYSTYLGGTGEDKAMGIAIDGSGNAYVTGFTVSADFPVSNAVQTARAGTLDAFIACVNPAGAALVYSTYLGGTGDETAYGIAGDAAGNVYITGITASNNFPAVNPVQPAYKGSTDALVAKISAGTPAIYAAAVLNAASFTAPVSAGGMATLFGSGLSDTSEQASGDSLPTTLAGTSMTVGGVRAPLFYVSPTQINFQLPWEIAGKGPLPLVVTTSAGTSNTLIITAASVAPAVFSIASSGTGQAVAVIANTTTFAAPAASIAGADARPASQGETITIYATGLGPVVNTPPTGQPAGASPLPRTTNTCAVTIGGVVATVTYCGLAPGFVGLYQVNAVVPSTATVGSTDDLVLTVVGVTAKTVTIAVQAPPAS